MMLLGCYLYVQKHQLVQTPQKRLLGRHMEMGVEGREKPQYGKKKNAFNSQARWLWGGRVFWFVLLF